MSTLSEEQRKRFEDKIFHFKAAFANYQLTEEERTTRLHKLVDEFESLFAEEIAKERERIANELARRVLKIEEMVTDEKGLHLIVNPDELEDGIAQLFTGNIFVYLLGR